MPIPEATLVHFSELLDALDPAPWTSWVEGRNHESGDSFVQVGDGASRKDDLYVFRSAEKGLMPAIAEQEFLTAARNLLPSLLDELRSGRASIGLARR